MAFAVKMGLSETAAGAGVMEMGVLLAVSLRCLFLAGQLWSEPLHLCPLTTVTWRSTDVKPERRVGTHSAGCSGCPVEQNTDLIL